MQACLGVDHGVLLGLEMDKGRAGFENLAATNSQQPQSLLTLGSILYFADSVCNASKAVDANGEQTRLRVSGLERSYAAA